MKFRWIPLSLITFLLMCSPAEAGKLLNWRFDTNRNSLNILTDQGVQPKAQLIFNPTRLVIDLPGTSLGRPSVKQSVNRGGITQVKIGQFNQQTTRIVVELANGYTIDPQQVRFRGVYANQWTVTLPTPQRISASNPLPHNISPTLPPRQTIDRSSNSNQSNLTPQAQSPYFRSTSNGIFIRLDSGSGKTVRTSRNRDGDEIEFSLPGTTLPKAIQNKSLDINRYGIIKANFQQKTRNLATLTLNVNPDSPNWRGSFTRLGDLILLPEGGMSQVENLDSQVVSSRDRDRDADRDRDRRGKATIQALELTSNNQLVIRADRNITARGIWNRNKQVYEITISNAKLDDRLKGPQLTSVSPISKLRVKEAGSDRVLILVEPAPGIQLGNISTSFNAVQLPLLRRGAILSPNRSNVVTINVPPPERLASSRLPSTTVVNNPTTRPSVPKGSILVVIDPGHGGKDPGTLGRGGVKEKDIVLPISQMVADILRRQGVSILMTRNSDYFVSLKGRTDMANRANAHLFVSIHANAINLSRPDVNGLETYYYQSGKQLADIIHRNFLNSVNIRDRRVRRARFYVLRNTRMPSVLVEVGFLTGAEDAPRLKNANHRRQVAEAIARGIIEYIQRNRR